MHILECVISNNGETAKMQNKVKQRCVVNLILISKGNFVFSGDQWSDQGFELQRKSKKKTGSHSIVQNVLELDVTDKTVS